MWISLGNLLQRGIGNLQVRRMFVDSGYNTQAVYDFARQHRGRAFATKGHATQDKPVRAVPLDVSFRGRTIKNGITLWHLDADYFKTFVHSRIQWPEEQPGGFHLPANASDDYCKQLVAEQRLVRPTGRVDWIKTATDNHYLDCEALAAAAAHTLAVYNLRPEATRNEPEPAGTPSVPSTSSTPSTKPAGMPAIPPQGAAWL